MSTSHRYLADAGSVEGHSRQVGKLAQHGHAEENIGGLGARRSVERVVYEIGHEGCKAPVVAAVLEEVRQWHGAMAEPALGKSMSMSQVQYTLLLWSTWARP